MFEDTPNQPNPNEPEDMFAPLDGQIQPGEIKSAMAHQKLKPVSPADSPLPEPPAVPPGLEEAPLPQGGGAEISPPLLSKKGLYIALAIVAVAALGAGTAWVLVRLPKTPKVEVPLPPVAAPSSAERSLGRPEAGTIQVAPEIPPAAPAEVAPAAPVDSDADGLTDEEETAQGTDPQLADTDSDTLTDYEEAMIWKTNPLKSDTDGDGYSDGTEVKNGYNPNGEGKLLEIPQ